ncbi:MAG: hypothetical protein K0R71_1826 [Bacillales bacterium]|nr:hypothetical protein [Bacillales bacterium]
MKNLSLSYVILFILAITFLFPSNIYATKWAYPYVVWNDYTYIVSEENVSEIDSKIGKVTYYSDMEAHSGNFSNEYKKGTKYYSIKGISTDVAIAIEESDGRYVRANRKGKHIVDSKFDSHYGGLQGIIGIFIFLIMCIITITLINTVKKKVY